MEAKRKRVIITTAVILILLGYLVYSTVGSSFLYYRTVSEVKTDKSLYGERVRVAGKVVEDSFEEAGDRYEFNITDGKEEIKVVYAGVLPSSFKEDAEVIAEGVYRPETGIEAKNLLARCPSKYTSK